MVRVSRTLWSRDDDAQVRPLAQGKDDLLHLGHRDGIDTAEGFVEHEQVRIGNERARDGQTPFFAAAERQREVLRDVGDAELFQQLLAARAPVLAVERQRFEDGQEVLLDGQLAEDGLLLRQVAHAEARAAVHGQRVTSTPLKVMRPAFGGTRPTIM